MFKPFLVLGIQQCTKPAEIPALIELKILKSHKFNLVSNTLGYKLYRFKSCKLLKKNFEEVWDMVGARVFNDEHIPGVSSISLQIAKAVYR